MRERRNEELMNVLELNESLECMARVRWYGHVLRREEKHMLKKAL